MTFKTDCKNRRNNNKLPSADERGTRSELAYLVSFKLQNSTHDYLKNAFIVELEASVFPKKKIGSRRVVR